jgi:hypothetical protein
MLAARCELDRFELSPCLCQRRGFARSKDAEKRQVARTAMSMLTNLRSMILGGDSTIRVLRPDPAAMIRITSGGDESSSRAIPSARSLTSASASPLVPAQITSFPSLQAELASIRQTVKGPANLATIGRQRPRTQRSPGGGGVPVRRGLSFLQNFSFSGPTRRQPRDTREMKNCIISHLVQNMDVING